MICFDARVQFKLGDKVKEFDTQVQIVTIEPKDLSSIYLLNLDILKLQLPDTFQGNKEVFAYIDDKCLLVHGNDSISGNYEVFFIQKLKNRHAQIPAINEIISINMQSKSYYFWVTL